MSKKHLAHPTPPKPWHVLHVILSFLILFSLFCSLTVYAEEKASEKRPITDLPAHKKSWEVGWTNDWKLLGVKREQTDHFKWDIVMEWEKQEGKQTRHRTDTFSEDWKYRSAWESLSEEGKLIARGYVYISPDGQPKWRMMVYLGEPIKVNDLHDYEILHYQLELFENGKVICTYQSSSNFLIDPTTLKLRRVPSDTKILWGKGPSVEELEDSNPEQKRGKKLLNETPKLSSFKEFFEVSEVKAFHGAIGSLDCVESWELWDGKFTPKKKFAFPCVANLVFGIPENGSPIVNLTPQEILNVFEEVNKVPFIQKLMSQDLKNDLHLRAAGDRLHWESNRVKEYAEILNRNHINASSERNWTKLILGMRPEKNLSLYHPMGSDIFIIDGNLFDSPEWMQSFKELTGLGPKEYNEFPLDNRKYLPLLNSNGKMTLLPFKEGGGKILKEQ